MLGIQGQRFQRANKENNEVGKRIPFQSRNSPTTSNATKLESP